MGRGRAGLRRGCGRGAGAAARSTGESGGESGAAKGLEDEAGDGDGAKQRGQWKGAESERTLGPEREPGRKRAGADTSKRDDHRHRQAKTGMEAPPPQGLVTNCALWHARDRFRVPRALGTWRIPRSRKSHRLPAPQIGRSDCHRASFVTNLHGGALASCANRGAKPPYRVYPSPRRAAPYNESKSMQGLRTRMAQPSKHPASILLATRRLLPSNAQSLR